MQTAQGVVTAVTSSLSTPAGSFRHLLRAGAVAIGIAGGIISSSNQIAAREAAFKAALVERDAEIAKLKSQNSKLEMEKSGQAAKPSSGDPIQDWVDSLSE